MTSQALRVGVTVVALAGAFHGLAAQRPDPGPAYATRASLEQGLAQAAHGTNRHSSAEARLIKARLDSGDFRSGDRIVLRVEGEKELSDTFTVGPATDITLPQIGVVPLTGVLRAELPDRLTQALSRYLRSPVVHVRSLVRISVEGEVGRPGFYGLAPETPLLDALSIAGGLTHDANLHKARVVRGEGVVLGGRTLQDAFAAGRSLDALSLQAGDRLVIPRRNDFGRTVQILGILATVPVAIFSLTQIFK